MGEPSKITRTPRGIVVRGSPEWALALGGLWLSLGMQTGCSSAPSSEAVSTSEAPAVVPATNKVVGASESARVQAYLDSRYAASDVLHSFKSKMGQAIDCVDFFATPAAKAAAAAGKPMSRLPVPPPLPESKAQTSASLEFDGQPDAEGNVRSCPAGAVPMVRITATDIQALGGMDAFEDRLARRARKVRPPIGKKTSFAPQPGGYCTQPFGVDLPYYGHVQQTFNPGDNGNIPPQPGPIQSGIATFSLLPTAPVPNDGSHDVGQIWAYSGFGFNYEGCTCTSNTSLVTASLPLCTQSVEAGWEISPGESTNPGALNAPYLFAFATPDGYNSGCEADEGSASCWVDNPGRTMAPNQSLYNQGLLTVAVERVTSGEEGWWVEANGSWLGYFPTSYYGSSIMTTTGAETFQAGGEVADPTNSWVMPMGSGANPTAGNEGGGSLNAAYVDNVSISCMNSSSCNTSTIIDTLPNYSYATSPSPPTSGLSNYFYYGNTSDVFWGTDYGDQWSPTNPADWANGDYKGQCGPGQSITGLSEYSSGQHQAHAVKCGGPGKLGSSSGCITEAFNNSDPANPSYNWDSGDNKAECPSGYYVQGISQTTQGALNSILCCPTSNFSVSSSTCSVQTLYSGNSAGFAHYADWDYGYHKANCPVTVSEDGLTPTQEVVAGVSARSSSPVGAPNAILCCNSPF
jgi:hypothetical protein